MEHSSAYHGAFQRLPLAHEFSSCLTPSQQQPLLLAAHYHCNKQQLIICSPSPRCRPQEAL
ncbi:hypothetical protein Dimus_030613, partial [Dionaea muscipula]